MACSGASGVAAIDLVLVVPGESQGVDSPDTFVDQHRPALRIKRDKSLANTIFSMPKYSQPAT
jgi:hypothetical protein